MEHQINDVKPGGYAYACTYAAPPKERIADNMIKITV